jgi:hypothetical protein
MTTFQTLDGQSMIMHRSVFSCPAVLGVLLAVGCGPGGYASAVNGVVTLDGKPLAGAVVTFHPDDKGPVAHGVSTDDGAYFVKTGANRIGLAPGDYRVTVFALAESGGPPGSTPRLLTPSRYSERAKTPLRFSIEAGRTEIDLPLESTADASQSPRSVGSSTVMGRDGK